MDSLWALLAAGKSEFGLCGVVGGMTVIELLAGKMRLDRGRIAAVGRIEDWIIFFAWGGSTMCHPPVPLIEDDCAA